MVNRARLRCQFAALFQLESGTANRTPPFGNFGLNIGYELRWRIAHRPHGREAEHEVVTLRYRTEIANKIVARFGVNQ